MLDKNDFIGIVRAGGLAVVGPASTRELMANSQRFYKLHLFVNVPGNLPPMTGGFDSL